MGKKNATARVRTQTSDSSPSAEPKTRKPRVVRSFVERLAAKAETIYKLASNIALKTEKRNVPAPIPSMAKTFVQQVEAFREKLLELRAGDWAPAKASEPFIIKEGDTVTVMAEHKDNYSYIPGVESAVLTVLKLVPQGKRTNVLVATSDGTPRGYIPKSHLVRS
jgi:hypothetical protein